MALVSKTEAAKLIGVSRPTLYDYIKKGRVSTTSDGDIDTAELLRAGFALQQDSLQEEADNLHDLTPETSGVGEVLERVNKLVDEVDILRKELQAKNEEREVDRVERERLWNLVESQQRLLTAAPASQPGIIQKIWWVLFGGPTNSPPRQLPPSE